MIGDAPVWVVAPTYWGSTTASLYDHPTPLRGESTLPRLLDSLLDQRTGPEITILILVAAAEEQQAPAATARVRGLLAPYRSRLRLAVAGVTEARRIERKLAATP